MLCKSLCQEVERQQKLEKTKGCEVGKGNVLMRVLCLFLGRKRMMSLVRACCSQQRAWLGRERAGHAWLSSTSSPHGDVLFSWQHLLLLYRARDRDCLQRRCQSLVPSFPTALHFSAQITSQTCHHVTNIDRFQPFLMSRMAGITYFLSTM